MRYQPDHKEEARAKLLDAAGRAFRQQGYGGIGVNGLAREAGLTSGALYGHFKSKDAAFAAAAVSGLEQLQTGIDHLQAELKDGWLQAFVDFYLSERLTCDLDKSCGLQSMTADVMRAGNDTRSQYEKALKRVVDSVRRGLPGGNDDERRQKAWALLALLSGGVTMARSLTSETVQRDIAAQLKHAALAMVSTGAARD